jgi:hypothetical protein
VQRQPNPRRKTSRVDARSISLPLQKGQRGKSASSRRRCRLASLRPPRGKSTHAPCSVEVGFASKVGRRAPTARYIKAQGKREARRPGYHTYPRSRPERPKYAGNYALSGLERLIVCYQGRRAPLRFALAPGSHISRRWRSVQTFEAKLD